MQSEVVKRSTKVIIEVYRKMSSKSTILMFQIKNANTSVQKKNIILYT